MATPGTLKWRITIEETIMAQRKMAPIHPGEVLSEEFSRLWASASTG